MKLSACYSLVRVSISCLCRAGSRCPPSCSKSHFTTDESWVPWEFLLSSPCPQETEGTYFRFRLMTSSSRWPENHDLPARLQVLLGEDQKEVGHVLHDAGGGARVLRQSGPHVSRTSGNHERNVSILRKRKTIKQGTRKTKPISLLRSTLFTNRFRYVCTCI